MNSLAALGPTKVPFTTFKDKLPRLNGPSLLAALLLAVSPVVAPLPLLVPLELVLVPLVGLRVALGLVLAPLLEVETPVETLVDTVAMDPVPVAAVGDWGAIANGGARFGSGSVL